MDKKEREQIYPSFERLFEKKISREKFLESLLPTSLGFLTTLWWIKSSTSLYERIHAPLEQLAVFKETDISAEEFLKNNKEILKKVKLGCSFSPEDFSLKMGQNSNGENSKDYSSVLQAFKIIVEDLKIRDVRLGIRWLETADEKGDFDPKRFSLKYKPYLDYCIEKGINICLNVGPIKVFRYPEDFVPDYVLNKLSSKLAKGSLIKPDMEIADRAASYLDEVLFYISSSYDSEELKKFVIIQPENEPFNPAGENRWIMSEEYLLEIIGRINHYFPQSHILLNSANYNDLRKISNLYKEAISQNPKIKGRLISGINFYFRKPSRPNLPVIGELDPVTMAGLEGKRSFEENIKFSQDKNFGYKIEVTELQSEPWETEKAPGNSAHLFFYSLKRSFDNLIDPQSQRSILRIWGIEELVGKIINRKLSSEHLEIIRSIIGINSFDG